MYWTRPGAPRRRLTAKRVLAILVAMALLLLGLGVKFWYETATDPSHWAVVIEELPISESWAVIGTDTTRGNFLTAAPSATRYYLVDMDSADITVALEAVVTSIGFQVDDRWDPACLRNPINATSGPMTCTVGAVRGRDQLWVTVYDRGQGADIYLGEDRSVMRVPDRAILRITARADR